MTSVLNSNNGAAASVTVNTPVGGVSAGLDLLQFIQDNRSTIANYTASADENGSNGTITAPIDPTKFDYGKLIMYRLESKLNLTDQQLANIWNGVYDLPGDAGKLPPATPSKVPEQKGGDSWPDGDWFEEDAPATDPKPFTTAQVISNLAPFVGSYVVSRNSPAYANSTFEIVSNSEKCSFHLYDTETDSLNVTPATAVLTGAGNSQDKTTFRMTNLDSSDSAKYLELQFAMVADAPADAPTVTFKTPANATGAVPKVGGHQVPPTRSVALTYWIGLYKFESSNLSGYGFAVTGSAITFGLLKDISPQEWPVVKHRVNGEKVEWDVLDRGRIVGVFKKETEQNGETANPSFHGTLRSGEKEEEVTAVFVEYTPRTPLLEHPVLQWWGFLATVGAIPGLIAIVGLIISLKKKHSKWRAELQTKLKAEADSFKTNLGEALLESADGDVERRAAIVSFVEGSLSPAEATLKEAYDKKVVEAGINPGHPTATEIDAIGREQVNEVQNNVSRLIYGSMVRQFGDKVTQNRAIYDTYIKIRLQETLAVKMEALKAESAKTVLWKELLDGATRERNERDRVNREPVLDTSRSDNRDGTHTGGSERVENGNRNGNERPGEPGEAGRNNNNRDRNRPNDNNRDTNESKEREEREAREAREKHEEGAHGKPRVK